MKRIFSFAMAAAILPLFAACTTEDPDVTISVSPATVEFAAEGGSANVVVTTDADSFDYSGQASWLTVTRDGKALNLEAEANTAQQARNCTITVSAGGKTATLKVSQAAASKYPGYAEVSLSNDPDNPGAYYMGTMLQMFDPTVEGTGGMAGFYFTVNSTEALTVSFFTQGFASQEEVYLPEGTYTPGEDLTGLNGFLAEPNTFVVGVTAVSDDEEMQNGTYISNSATGAVTNLTAGSFTITENEDGTFLIKMDFKDAEGNDYKYFYEGEILFDATLSFYPSTGEAVDPSDVDEVAATYLGAVDGHPELCSIQIGMAPASIVPMTIIDFNMAYADFSADMDLSGAYNAVDTPAVGINKGDSENFSGTYIMISFTDMFWADGASTMTLTKNADGTYDLAATLSSSTGDSYTYDLKNIAIAIEDGTAFSDEEYID